MTKKPGLSDIVLLSVVIIGVIAAATVLEVASQGYNGAQNNGTYPGNLVLNVYIDDGGKALITGYADSIYGLLFLKGSQYKYDNNTKQLYVLTNSLTDKSGDDWETTLPTQGNYSEYHSIFYLPASVKISRIDPSQGLDYLVSAANDSFQVDFHGYDVKSPTITIDYQLPLRGGSSPGVSNTRLMTQLAALLGLALVSAGLFVWRRRRSAAPFTPAEHPIKDPIDLISEAPEHPEALDGSAEENSPQTSDHEELSGSEDYFVGTDDLPVETNLGPKVLDNSTVEFKDNINISKPGDGYKAEDGAYGPDKEIPEEGESDQSNIEVTNIEITSEMAAVMETLTARERAVLTALIENNGKMNQADIRYETSIPKSSLTGILLSLERRKLITKKEKGRTNAIELSDWFLSKTDHSESDK